MTEYIDIVAEYSGKECMQSNSKMKVQMIDSKKRVVARTFEELYGMLGYGIVEIDGTVYEIPSIEYYGNADIIGTMFEMFKEYCITGFRFHASKDGYVSAYMDMQIEGNAAHISIYAKKGYVRGEVKFWNVQSKFEYRKMNIPTLRNLLVQLQKELDRAIEDYRSVKGAFKTAGEIENDEVRDIEEKLRKSESNEYGEINYHYTDNLGNIWSAYKTPFDKEFTVKINGTKFGTAKDVHQIAQMIYAYLHGKGVEKPVKVVQEKKVQEVKPFNLEEFLNKTPADLDEEFAVEYEEFEKKVRPLREKLKKLKIELEKLPKRDKRKAPLKEEINAIKKEIAEMEREFENKQIEQNFKEREELEKYIREKYEVPDEETMADLLDEFFIYSTERGYVERTWKMKLKDVLDLVLKEFVKEGRIKPKGAAMPVQEKPVQKSEVEKFREEKEKAMSEIREKIKSAQGMDICEAYIFAHDKLKELSQKLKALNAPMEVKKELAVIPEDISTFMSKGEVKCYAEIAKTAKKKAEEGEAKKYAEQKKLEEFLYELAKEKPARGFEPNECCGHVIEWNKKYSSYKSAQAAAKKLEGRISPIYRIQVFRTPGGGGMLTLKVKDVWQIEDWLKEKMKEKTAKREMEVEVRNINSFIKKVQEEFPLSLVGKGKFENEGEYVFNFFFRAPMSKLEELKKKHCNAIGITVAIFRHRFSEKSPYTFSIAYIEKDQEKTIPIYDGVADSITTAYNAVIAVLRDLFAGRLKVKCPEPMKKIPVKYHTKEEEEKTIEELSKEAEMWEYEEQLRKNEKTLYLRAEIEEKDGVKYVHIYACMVRECLKPEKERHYEVNKYIPLTNGAYARNYFWKIYKVYREKGYEVVYNLDQNEFLYKLFKVREMEKKLGVANVEESNEGANVENLNIDEKLANLSTLDKICNYIREHTVGPAGVKRYTGDIPFDKLEWKLRNMLRYYFTHDVKMTDEEFDSKYWIVRTRVGNRNIVDTEKMQYYGIKDFTYFIYNVCANGWDIHSVLSEYELKEKKREIDAEALCDKFINTLKNAYPVMLEMKRCYVNKQTMLFKFKFTTTEMNHLGIKGFVVKIENECMANPDLCKEEKCNESIFSVEVDKRLIAGTYEVYRKIRTCSTIEVAYDKAKEIVIEMIEKVMAEKKKMKVKECKDILNEYKKMKSVVSVAPIMQYKNGNCVFMMTQNTAKGVFGSKNIYCIELYDMEKAKVFTIGCAETFAQLYDEVLRWKENNAAWQRWNTELRDVLKFIKNLIGEKEIERERYRNYKSLISDIEKTLPFRVENVNRSAKELTLTANFVMPSGKEEEWRRFINTAGGYVYKMKVVCEQHDKCSYGVYLINMKSNTPTVIATGSATSPSDAYHKIYDALRDWVHRINVRLEKKTLTEQASTVVQKKYVSSRKGKGADVKRFVAFLNANKLNPLYNVNVRHEIIKQSLFGKEVQKDESWVCRRVQFTTDGVYLKIDCDGNKLHSLMLRPSKIVIEGHNIRVLVYEDGTTEIVSMMW